MSGESGRLEPGTEFDSRDSSDDDDSEQEIQIRQPRALEADETTRRARVLLLVAFSIGFMLFVVGLDFLIGPAKRAKAGAVLMPMGCAIALTSGLLWLVVGSPRVTAAAGGRFSPLN